MPRAGVIPPFTVVYEKFTFRGEMCLTSAGEYAIISLAFVSKDSRQLGFQQKSGRGKNGKILYFAFYCPFVFAAKGLF